MKTLSHKFITITALLALFAVFLICTDQSGDFVLCLSEDGHIAFEAYVNGQCECERMAHNHECQSLSLQYVFDLSQHHGHDHSDIPIFMNDISEYTPQKEFNLPLDKTFTISYIHLETSFYDNIFIEIYIIEPPPCINPTLASISSVILLS